MERGYTQMEAEALVNQFFETEETLGPVPRHTRGRVVAALDVGDHWNVLIEWEHPHLTAQTWYDKFDVQRSMREIHPGRSTRTTGEETKTLEIRSSHDLAAVSADARRTGRHFYQVDYREFTTSLHSWQNDRVQRRGLLGLTTLARERIWITTAETKQVAAAIAATRSQVAVD